VLRTAAGAGRPRAPRAATPWACRGGTGAPRPGRREWPDRAGSPGARRRSTEAPRWRHAAWPRRRAVRRRAGRRRGRRRVMSMGAGRDER
jgi:hypothetical protein